MSDFHNFPVVFLSEALIYVDFNMALISMHGVSVALINIYGNKGLHFGHRWTCTVYNIYKGLPEPALMGTLSLFVQEIRLQRELPLSRKSKLALIWGASLFMQIPYLFSTSLDDTGYCSMYQNVNESFNRIFNRLTFFLYYIFPIILMWHELFLFSRYVRIQHMFPLINSGYGSEYKMSSFMATYLCLFTIAWLSLGLPPFLYRESLNSRFLVYQVFYLVYYSMHGVIFYYLRGFYARSYGDFRNNNSRQSIPLTAIFGDESPSINLSQNYGINIECGGSTTPLNYTGNTSESLQSAQITAVTTEAGRSRLSRQRATLQESTLENELYLTSHKSRKEAKSVHKSSKRLKSESSKALSKKKFNRKLLLKVTTFDQGQNFSKRPIITKNNENIKITTSREHYSCSDKNSGQVDYKCPSVTVTKSKMTNGKEKVPCIVSPSTTTTGETVTGEVVQTSSCIKRSNHNENPRFSTTIVTDSILSNRGTPITTTQQRKGILKYSVVDRTPGQNLEINVRGRPSSKEELCNLLANYYEF